MSELKDDDASSAAEELCVRYWNELSDSIEPWRMVKNEELKPAEARIEFIVAPAVAFWALGTAVVTRHQTRSALSKRICYLVDPDRFEDAPRVLEAT